MTAQNLSPTRLRALLKQDGMIVAPGAYDCISARVIAQAGFPAVYMTGAGTAAMLGYPDFGLVTMSEMAENAGRIAAAVGAPVRSSTWPSRPSLILLSTSLRNVSFWKNGRVSGVSTNVGPSVLTRILCGASSIAIALVKPSMACFEAQ